MTQKKRTTGKVDYFLGNRDLDQLPHDISTEQIVLGAMMMSQDIFNECYASVSATGMFYGPLESEVWDLMASLAASNLIADAQAVSAHFNSTGRPQQALQIRFWVSEAVPYVSRLKSLCIRLTEYWVRRSLHRMTHDVNTQSIDMTADPMELLGRMADGNASIFQHITSMKEVKTGDVSVEVLKQIEQMQSGVRFGLQSSISALDAITRGYQNSELTIIGAGSGEGKSTLAFQEIDYQASQGFPVGAILLEMTKAQMVLLMACARQRISIRDVKTAGGLTKDQFDRLGKSIQDIGRLPIHVVDTPGLKGEEIKATFRRWKKQHGIRSGWLDHLHLAKHNNPLLSPEQAFTSLANDGKELAKELDIPMIYLAQLARRERDQKRRKHEPTDLKYAGGIEQAADCVLLVYRWEKHDVPTDENGNSTKGKALIQVGKLRMMEPQDVPVFFTGQRFVDNESNDAKDPFPFPIDRPSAGIKPKYDNEDDLPF